MRRRSNKLSRIVRVVGQYAIHAKYHKKGEQVKFVTLVLARGRQGIAQVRVTGKTFKKGLENLQDVAYESFKNDCLIKALGLR